MIRIKKAENPQRFVSMGWTLYVNPLFSFSKHFIQTPENKLIPGVFIE